MIHLLFVLFCISISADSFSQPVNGKRVESFIHDLFANDSALVKYFNPEEIRRSTRFGIEYEGVKFKHLISLDFEEPEKQRVRDGAETYRYSLAPIDSVFSKLTILLSESGKEREFFFRNSSIISAPSYYARNWKTYESEFVVYHTSSSELINAYAINAMSDFIREMMSHMRFSEMEKRKLAEEKIHYYLCRDEDEIRQLTGYAARGMYFLPYDYIISTYNFHCHEMLHLLMNFRLGRQKMYPEPFFQEGFAVAFGGRGGLAAATVLDMGAYVLHSGFIESNELLSRAGFGNVDPSIAYPAAGVMNRKLIECIGFDAYLSLYKKYSRLDTKSGDALISGEDIRYGQLVSAITLDIYNSVILVTEAEFSGSGVIEYSHNNVTVKSDSEYYYFSLREPVFITDEILKGEYISNLIKEAAPSRAYRGEKYFIRVKENEISVYNLLTNTLIANYVKSFSGNGQGANLPLNFFKLRKTLLEGSPDRWKID